MWYLISLENPDVKYALLTKKTYFVGRKNCDILLAGDASVSRKHAQIELVHPESNITNPEKLPTISLTDLSKFGTTVNGDKILQETIQLKDGDIVQFGTNSTFTVVYEPFIISSSCLDQPSKKKVRQLVAVLGGHMVNDWKKECCLLVMNNISVTIKVVCALVSLKNIVSPDYLEKYVGHLKGENEKPNPDIYLPEVTETQVDSNEVSFKVIPERRNIFQGMKFIFLNEKQFKKMHLAVELGGGLPVLLEEKWQNDRMLVEKGSVVMQCEPNNCTQVLSQDSHNWLLHVQAYLRKHKKHMIQDAELGFAVLYCSTEKHCNPDVDTAGGSQMMNPVPSQSVSNTDVLVANTEVSPNRSPTRVRKKKCETVLEETRLEKQEKLTVKQENSQTRSNIPEQTVTENNGTGQQRSKVSNKRGRIEEDEEVPESTPLKKKVKQEIGTPGRSESENRKRSSQRRSPSPAARSSPRKRGLSPSVQIESERGASSRTSPRQQKAKDKVKKEIIEDSDEEIDNKKSKRHVIVEDSDDEFPDFMSSRKAKETKNIKKSVVDSESESSRFVSKTDNKSERKKAEVIQLSESDEEFHVGKPKQGKKIKKEASPTPRSKLKHVIDSDSDTIQNNVGKEQTNKTGAGKRKILVEDSDEDLAVQQKGKKKKLSENFDDEFDRIMSKTKTVKQKENSGNIRENSDDEFDRIMGKKNKNVEEDNNDTNNSKNRMEESPEQQSNGQFRTTPDNGVDQAVVKTEPEILDNGEGFVSTSKQDEDEESRPSEYVKEEDLPSKCINIKFVDLVARKPTGKPPKSSTEKVPEGYMKWQGKIVRNFKKFKKTEHSGANTLPRIIGGSDLVAHTASNRKDLDDWFKDAIQAESQQNESERKAQELFDWEPNKKRSR